MGNLSRLTECALKVSSSSTNKSYSKEIHCRRLKAGTRNSGRRLYSNYPNYNRQG